MRVLISCPQMQVEFPTFADTFAAKGIEAVLPQVRQQLTEVELLPIIDGFDGVIAGDDHFTGAVLARASKLRILSKWGVGIDNIDLEAASRLGIPVTNTPGTFDDEVADVCVGYLVLLARSLHRIDAGVRAGEWTKVEGRSLNGRTLGIVGLGGIGRALARRAVAMNMHVVGSDPSDAAVATAAGLGVEPVLVDELFARADAISLNCPLTATNHHLLDASAFALMRPGVLLVNTARGPLIQEEALIQALDRGIVAGAALDVFESEPVGRNHALTAYDQVVLGSHNATNTHEAVARVSALAVANLLAGLGVA
jgi:D-3-phosphoglycerate dehydrogenase